MSYSAEEIVAQYRERLNTWGALRARIMHIDALVQDRWAAVFPGDERDVAEPMVRNIFRHTIEDGGRQFAEALPTERVPDAGPRDERRAADRELVLTGYTQRSGTWDVAEYHGQDMIATGFTAIKVWPDFGRPPADRFPMFHRLNPRKVLPEPRWAPDKPTDNVIVHYTETIARLQEQFPEPMRELLARLEAAADERLKNFRTTGYDLSQLQSVRATPAELEVIDFYSSRHVCRVGLYSDPDTGDEVALLLSERSNETGLCPVQMAYRPTWATEPLGDLNDFRGIVRTKNRYMRLLLDYFIDMVYGGKLAWNVRNPSDRGPGTIFHALGPDAKMEPVTPTVPSFQAFQMLGLLEDESHGPSNPRAREGEVELNKATAAFLNRAQGPLTSVVRSLQRNFAACKRRANEVAFAQDEAWCNSRKVITGIARGRRFSLTYTPTEIIKGDHANIVTYGSASGLDAPTHQILVNQKVQLGLLPTELALEQDPTIDDVPSVLSMLAEQRMRDAILAGLMEPGTDMATRARAWQAFRGNDDVNKAIDALVAAVPAPGAVPAALPAAAGGINPAAPPGIAGAEGTAVQGAPLPPLDTLRRVPPRR
jgi:hypothetical protein